jgi:hypothetical protein
MNDDPETLRALVSGFIAGAAVALASTFIVLIALARGEYWRRLPQNQRVPMPLVGVVFVNLFMLTWTALGLLLGALYLRAESDSPDGGLLSPNRLFTVAIVIVVASLLAATAVVRGRPGWPVWSTALIAVLAFGWMLPWMAQ